MLPFICVAVQVTCTLAQRAQNALPKNNNFREWALLNGYDKDAAYRKCTIDRIDNNKGYSPDNCRWVDQKAQNNNYSRNRIIEYNGESHNLAQYLY